MCLLWVCGGGSHFKVVVIGKTWTGESDCGLLFEFLKER